MSKLDEIIAHKRREVSRAQAELAAAVSEGRVFDDTSQSRGFKKALESVSGPALIAEVKKASPSRGLIRPDFDPAEVALAYKRAGAQCLSVLTDERYFQGSLVNLRIAREVSGLPCLRKDFIIDAFQIEESMRLGADAILLIVAALSQDQLIRFYELAKALGLDVLVEVHNQAEAEVALELGCDMIGINNRNLSDFTTSLSVTEQLAPMIRDHALVVSESAIETQADVRRVAAAGARAVLIGTTFCASPDIETKVREVMAW